MADVFQFLPNFAHEPSVSFSIPMSYHNTDYQKEQRHTTSTRSIVLYGPGNSLNFFQYEAIRTYRATYTEMGSKNDFQIINRLRALRGAPTWLPFFLEPIAATADLGGQTLATISSGEIASTQFKFMSPKVVRLSLGNRAFYEVRDLANTYQDVINNSRIQVTAAWSASLAPGNCRLYFADTVYHEENLPRTNESDKVHQMPVLWQSL